MGTTSRAAFWHGHHTNGEFGLGLLGSTVLVLAKQFLCSALHSGHGFSSRCMDEAVY